MGQRWRTAVSGTVLVVAAGCRDQPEAPAVPDAAMPPAAAAAAKAAPDAASGPPPVQVWLVWDGGSTPLTEAQETQELQAPVHLRVLVPGVRASELGASVTSQTAGGPVEFELEVASVDGGAVGSLVVADPSVAGPVQVRWRRASRPDAAPEVFATSQLTLAKPPKPDAGPPKPAAKRKRGRRRH